MSRCAKCGAAFSCAVADGAQDETCWCMQLPPLPADTFDAISKASESARCLCHSCMAALTRQAASRSAKDTQQ
jgi:hypothetical protein